MRYVLEQRRIRRIHTARAVIITVMAVLAYLGAAIGLGTTIANHYGVKPVKASYPVCVESYAPIRM